MGGELSYTERMAEGRPRPSPIWAPQSHAKVMYTELVDMAAMRVQIPIRA